MQQMHQWGYLFHLIDVIDDRIVAAGNALPGSGIAETAAMTIRAAQRYG